MPDPKDTLLAQITQKAQGIGPDPVMDYLMGSGRTLVSGMMGGLPSGLNPGAIMELLKRMNISGGAGRALGPTSRALKDVVERRVRPGGALPPGVSERRYSELLQRFGGTGEP